MSAAATVASAVREALDELQTVFELTLEPQENGGVFVTVRQLEIGAKWSPAVIDLVFEIPFNYPFAAIYPYYCAAPLSRVDGGVLPQGLQTVQWRNGNWTQISLRKNQWSPQVDTALSSVLQVQHWLETA